MAGERSKNPHTFARERSLRIVGTMVALATAALIALVVPVSAGATGTLDQSQTSFDLIDQVPQVSGVVFGSTFTAGISGDLDQVDLYLFRNPSCPADADLRVEIQRTSGGKPTGDVLAGTAVSPGSVPLTPGFLPIHFSPAAPVTAGTQYAIVVWTAASTCSPGPPSPYQIAHGLGGSVYPGGSFVHSANGGASWLIDQFDGTFNTYVEGAPQLLDNLSVASAGVGPSNSLAAKVHAAQNALSAGNTAAACTSLGDFARAVDAQTGKKIPDALAAQLVAGAARVRAVIGC